MTDIQKRNKRNKQRGKETEKRLINRLSSGLSALFSKRVGILGEEDGVIVLDDKILYVEVKSRKHVVFAKWWEQAKKVVEKRKQKNAMPILTVQEFSKKRAFVILEMEDFFNLFKKEE